MKSDSWPDKNAHGLTSLINRFLAFNVNDIICHFHLTPKSQVRVYHMFCAAKAYQSNYAANGVVPKIKSRSFSRRKFKLNYLYKTLQHNLIIHV